MRKKFFFLGILLGVCLASPAQFTTLAQGRGWHGGDANKKGTPAPI